LIFGLEGRRAWPHPKSYIKGGRAQPGQLDCGRESLPYDPRKRNSVGRAIGFTGEKGPIEGEKRSAFQFWSALSDPSVGMEVLRRRSIVPEGEKRKEPTQTTTINTKTSKKHTPTTKGKGQDFRKRYPWGFSRLRRIRSVGHNILRNDHLPVGSAFSSLQAGMEREGKREETYERIC